MPAQAKPSKKSLTLRDWWLEVGSGNLAAVAASASTSAAYLRLIAYRYKRPSYDKALAIIAAARKVTPGFVPDLDLMMRPLSPKAKRGGNGIKPSERFARSAARRGAAA